MVKRFVLVEHSHRQIAETMFNNGGGQIMTFDVLQEIVSLAEEKGEMVEFVTSDAPNIVYSLEYAKGMLKRSHTYHEKDTHEQEETRK